jgi:3'(2'), 5'-bisphosphate nucleotidase
MLATDTDDVAAAVIAFEAGQLLLSIRMQDHSTGSSPDVTSNELILRRLHERFHDDAVLSEESVDNLRRLDQDRVWIIDPLDGTREYGEAPRDDWAVHVALLETGVLRAGAVALPAKAMVFSTAAPFARPPRDDGPIRVAVSRSRPPVEADKVRDGLGAVLVPMGSAGVKAMAVVRGEVDAYLHAGGQYEWDSAAPVAVAEANGLHTSRIDGTPFRWNQSTPWQPDLLVCRPEYAALILDEIGK